LKDRKYNDQMKTNNNDTQSTTQKNKDWATRTPLKNGDELMCSRNKIKHDEIVPSNRIAMSF
jgi:hypothetical protein